MKPQQKQPFFSKKRAPIGAVLHAVVVTVLAQPTPLKTWAPDDIQKLKRAPGGLTAQKLIFEESAQSMDLNARADIDLVTVYGKSKTGEAKVARVPRFMVWRDAFKLNFDAKTKQLSSHALPTRLKLPLDLFELTQIDKIELSQHNNAYPGTRLQLRTNPAASRGEKLFTQNCLACHTLGPDLLNAAKLAAFKTKHEHFQGISLELRDLRGLEAYREALESEKSKVESAK